MFPFDRFFAFVRSFVRSLARSFARSFIRSFLSSFVRSFVVFASSLFLGFGGVPCAGWGGRLQAAVVGIWSSRDLQFFDRPGT
jgi:hypothetical protein